jgi:hypothetical protein
LVVDDINKNDGSVSISYINPCDGLEDIGDAEPGPLVTRAYPVLHKLKNFIQSIQNTIKVNHKKYTRATNRLPVIQKVHINERKSNSDTALIVLIVVTFIYNRCNIFIKMNEIANIRKKFALALTAGKFNTFN